MEEIDQDESQQSNYMDLTLSPENIKNTTRSDKIILDRPPRNFGKIDNLRSIQELPAKYRGLFEFPFFNIIQSHVLDDVLYSDVSIVISSPTGSGKTVVFELAIIKLLMNFEVANYSGDYKIIYVAPVKALCNERLSEWHSKFSNIGVSCIVVTGDSNSTDFRNLKNYNIIITTPEKWDSLTRNMKDSDIIESVKLFMIDEVHLLNEETRGPILEAVLSRMKILKKKEPIRFIAASATIPNIEDIADWIGSNQKPAVYFKIGEELRPVKLNKVVLGYPCSTGTATFKFDVSLNYKLQSVLLQYAEGKPTLIFCSTRKGVEMTAKHISQGITFHLTPSQSEILNSAAKTMFDVKMKQQLTTGVGCHHAGMSIENRNTIETLFRDGQMPVLVTTSTLAMGVNLPAHLVVIKNTQQYINGQFQNYSESSLLQMIGRAGRPQFDKTATVVIMTTQAEKSRYEKMLGGTELIESNLHRHLTEHLNAEVALGIITDIAVALIWLRNTFLYVRVLKNPKYYNMPTNCTKDKIEKKLQDLCQIEINALNKHGMLQIDQTDGFSLYSTNIGALMANYYLNFNTMKLFAEIKGSESLFEILTIITKCEEFSESYLRVNDKKTLNTLNRCKYQSTIRFPLPGNIKTTAMKVNCIIQATFGCLRIQNPALCQESIKIMRMGEKITKSLVTYLQHKNTYFTALLNSLILNQCFNAKIWENSNFVSIQLNKIGNVLSSMLVAAGKTTFKSILESTPRDLERIINRAPPMGNDLQDAVLHLPFYKINVEPSNEQGALRIKISITLINAEDILQKCTAGKDSYMTLLVGDSENKILLCKKLLHYNMAISKNFLQYVDVFTKSNHIIYVHLISKNWVGIDCQEKFDIIVNEVETIQNITNSLSDNSTKTIKRKIDKKSSNSSEITSYFPVAKKANQTISTINNKTNSTPNVSKPKTIDSYFKKQNSSEQKSKLGFLVPKNYVATNKDDSLNKNNKIIQTKVTPNVLENKLKFPKSSIEDSVKQNIFDTKVQSNFGNSELKINYFNRNSPKINENYFSDFKNNSSTPKTIKNTEFNPNFDILSSNFEESKNLDFSFLEPINNYDEIDSSKTNFDLPNITNTNPFLDTSYQSLKVPEILEKSLMLEDSKQIFEDDNKEFNFFSNENVSNFEFDQNNNSQEFEFETQKINENFEQDQNFILPQETFTQNEKEKRHKILLESNKQKNYLGQENFEKFSEHLARKFDNSQLSQKSSMSLKTYYSPKKLYQNVKPNFSQPNILDIKMNNSKNNRNLKNDQKKMLSNFQFTPRKKFSYPNSNNSEISYKNENNKSFDKENHAKYQTLISNEDIKKYSRYIQEKSNNIKSQKSKNNFSTSRNTQNFEETEINSSSSLKNSNISQNIANKNMIESNFEKAKEKNTFSKPYFPKTFREYVQNSIDKIKSETLVNEHCNFDFGFQEFLMGPLDKKSDDESEEDEEKGKSEKIINKEEERNEPEGNNTDFSQKSLRLDDTDITFCENEEIMKIPKEKEETNTMLEETLDSFHENLENNKSISYSPEENHNNLSFLSTENNFSNTEQFSSEECQFSDINAFESNSENSQYEFSQKRSGLKIENRLKIIEQFYDTQTKKNDEEECVFSPEIIPLKKMKFADSKNIRPAKPKNQFFDVNNKQDSLKNMYMLKKITSNYRDKHNDKILISNNSSNEKNNFNEPVVNQVIKSTAYSYSMNDENQKTVQISVTVYQKEEKSVSSFSKPYFNFRK